jgi:hypothetical protein
MAMLFSNLNLGGMMSEIELPTDWEELGNLIESGEMTTEQVDGLVEQHGHCVHDCDEVCMEIWEAFDSQPLILLLEHNMDRLTIEQCEGVYQRLEDHILPEDQGTRANVWSAKLRLAVDRGLIANAKEDLGEWLDSEFLEGTFTEQEIQDSVRDYALKLAGFENCEKVDLEAFIAAYHNPGFWRSGGLNCEGEVESCDSCQEILQGAMAKLKK